MVEVVEVGMGWGEGIVVGVRWICGRGEFGVCEGAVGISLRGEEEGLGSVSGFGFSGVLKGDLKGWERVWEAVSMRRRFEGRIGDILGVVAW